MEEDCANRSLGSVHPWSCHDNGWKRNSPLVIGLCLSRPGLLYNNRHSPSALLKVRSNSVERRIKKKMQNLFIGLTALGFVLFIVGSGIWVLNPTTKNILLGSFITGLGAAGFCLSVAAQYPDPISAMSTYSVPVGMTIGFFMLFGFSCLTGFSQRSENAQRNITGTGDGPRFRRTRQFGSIIWRQMRTWLGVGVLSGSVGLPLGIWSYVNRFNLIPSIVLLLFCGFSLYREEFVLTTHRDSLDQTTA